MHLNFSISKKGVCSFLTQKNPKKLCSSSCLKINYFTQKPQLQREGGEKRRRLWRRRRRRKSGRGKRKGIEKAAKVLSVFSSECVFFPFTFIFVKPDGE